jgi:hypothetical protein
MPPQKPAVSAVPPQKTSSAPAVATSALLLVVLSALVVTEAIVLGWIISLQGARLERLATRQDQLAENFSTLAAKLAREVDGSDLAADGAIAYPLDPESVEVETEGGPGPDAVQRIVATDANGQRIVAVPDVRAAIDRYVENYVALPGQRMVYLHETCLACDGDGFELIGFDTATGLFHPFTDAEELVNAGIGDWHLSTDKTKILAPVFDDLEIRSLFVFDLVAGEGKRLALPIKANESLTEFVAAGLELHPYYTLAWIDGQNAEYRVYDASKTLVIDDGTLESPKRRLLRTATVTIE